MGSERETVTGIDELDRDLETFFEMSDSEQQLASMKRAIHDTELSLTALSDVIPNRIIKLVLALTEPAAFALLLEECEDSGKAQLTRAHDLAEEHFAHLRSHPAMVEVAKQQRDTFQRSRRREKLRLNTIAGLGYIPGYSGSPPKLISAVRVGFRDIEGKLLLDSLLDWDDLLYVTKALADIAADEFSAAEKLNEAKMLDLSEEYRRQVGGHIRELAKHLERLRELAPQYGIETD